VGDVVGNARVGEEPDIDGVASPFGGVDTAASLVEAITVGLGAAALDGTARVGRLAIGLDVAVVGVEGATVAEAIDGAAVAGVQSHLVGGLSVDTLDDIDFAVVGPVAAEHPTRED